MKLACAAFLAFLLLPRADARNVFVTPADPLNTAVAAFTTDPLSFVANYAAGAGPLKVLTTTSGNKFYVVSRSGTDTVVVLEGTYPNLAATRRFSLGSPATDAAITPDGQRLLVLAGGGLQIFDTTSESILSPMGTINVGQNPRSLAVSLGGARAYVLSRDSQILTAMDLSTNTSAGTVSIPGISTTVAVGPNGLVYVGAQNAIYEIDGSTLSIRNTIPVRAQPGMIAFTPDGRGLIAVNETPVTGTSAVYVDLVSRSVSEVAPVGVVLDRLAVVSNSRAFGASTQSGRLFDIAMGPTGVTGSTEASPGGAALTGVRDITATNELPDARFLLVATTNSVQRYDISSNQILGQASITFEPGILSFTAPGSTAPAASLILYNNNQLVAPGSQPLPLIVRAVDATGKPAGGVPVAFTTSSGATLATPNSTTNAQGYAQTVITLPTGMTTGNVSVTATAGTNVSATYTIGIGTSTGGGGTTPGFQALEILRGQGQVLPVSSVTEQPLTVRVRDAAGAPVAGATVNWALTEGEGNVLPAVTTTDANGEASATFVTASFVQPAQGFLSSTVTASTANESVIFYVTALPIQSGIRQDAQITISRPADRVLSGATGETAAGAIEVRAVTITGVPIPNVGVTLMADPDAPSGPTASCQNRFVLTDTTGLGVCNVVFGSVVGTGNIVLRVSNRVFDLALNVTQGTGTGTGNTLRIVQGSGQSGTAGQPLPTQLVAEVLNAAGSPAPNVDVQWQVVTAGTVTLSDVQNRTNAQGRVSARATLGPTPGTAQVRITAGTATQTFNFTITGAGQTTGRIEKTGGDNQSAAVNQPFAQPLTVRVLDAANQPVAGAQVTFAVTSGSVIIGSTTVPTNAQGQASTTVTAGTAAGGAVVTATAGNQSAAFNLTVTSTAVVIGRLEKLPGGENQSAPVNQPFGQPLTVRAVDANNQPIPGTQVTFAVTSGAVTLGSTTATTDAQGQASTTVTAGASPGNVVITAASGGQSATFNLTVRTAGPALTPASIVNGAGFQPGISPGSIAIIQGAGIATGTQGTVTANPILGSLPNELAGVRVTFNGIPAPIYFVSNVSGQEQVAVQVPFEVPAGTASVTVQTTTAGSTTVEGVQILPAKPGIFENMDISGRRYAVAVRPDGSYVTSTNPVRRGETIRAFVTGLGQVNPRTDTGRAGIPDQMVQVPVIVGLNNEGIRLISAEYMPGLIGVYLVTFEVPENTPSGFAQPFAVAVVRADGELEFGNSSLLPVQ